MPVLQIWKKKGEVTMLKGYLKPIDDDPRTRLMPKNAFIDNQYLIGKNVYMTKSDIIIKMARDDDATVDALYCTHDGKDIVIMPKKSYVFFNGRSVEPKEFSVRSVISSLGFVKKIAAEADEIKKREMVQVPSA